MGAEYYLLRNRIILPLRTMKTDITLREYTKRHQKEIYSHDRPRLVAAYTLPTWERMFSSEKLPRSKMEHIRQENGNKRRLLIAIEII